MKTVEDIQTQALGRLDSGENPKTVITDFLVNYSHIHNGKTLNQLALLSGVLEPGVTGDEVKKFIVGCH